MFDVKDLKQQNQYQVFERQLDESRCAMQELQRENTTLKKQLKDRWDNFLSLTFFAQSTSRVWPVGR